VTVGALQVCQDAGVNSLKLLEGRCWKLLCNNLGRFYQGNQKACLFSFKRFWYFDDITGLAVTTR